MRLETDPTVQYALGYQESAQTWWKSPLSVEDLGIASPYNTYLNYSLPPTAIANPDLTSLQAVAFRRNPILLLPVHVMARGDITLQSPLRNISITLGIMSE